MRPILFNTEMVRKILSGEKTVTRRVVKPLPPEGARLEYSPKYGEALDYATNPYPMPNERVAYKAPYQPDDILYVRETWGDYREYYEDGEGPYVLYRADYPEGAKTVPFPENEKTDYADSWDLPKWHPAIHMPREYARIFLRVTEVRVERLQEIDRKGVKAEGAESKHGFGATRGAFIELWNSTIKPTEQESYGWATNPWVWVIEFERCERPKEE